MEAEDKAIQVNHTPLTQPLSVSIDGILVYGTYLSKQELYGKEVQGKDDYCMDIIQVVGYHLIKFCLHLSFELNTAVLDTEANHWIPATGMYLSRNQWAL